MSLQTTAKTKRSIAVSALSARVRGTWPVESGTIEILDGTTVGSSEEPITLAGWVGPWNAAYGFFYEEGARTDVVLQYFTNFRFQDTTDGLIIGLPTHMVARVEALVRLGPDLVMVVESLETTRTWPNGPGANVEVGEVWSHRETIPDGPELRRVYLETDTAAASIYHHGDGLAAAEEAAADLLELQIL